jgi:O-succinylbenzoic acid--CoA ligase
VLLAAREVPDQVALIDGPASIRFGELGERVRERMRALAPLASGAGSELVALDAPEQRSCIELILALIELGVPFFPLHQRATATEKAALLSSLPVTCCVATQGAQLELRPLPGRLADEATAVFDRTPMLAAIATSGSSGAPRVALLARSAFAAAAAASAAVLGWRADDRWLLCLPLAHIGGLSVVTRCLTARKAVVLCGGRAGSSSEQLAMAIDTGRPTLISVVPAQLDGLLGLPGFELPGSVRVILTGGAASSPRLLERCAARAWPVLTSYGLTEACSQVATRLPGSGEAAGVGAPLPGIGVSIEGGLIRVTGPTLASGYLSGDRVELFDPVRGFLTRDMGHLDAAGQLHVLGRADDVIISGGENIAPLEIESALVQCPGVLEVCVFGVEDARWGQVVAAGIRTSDAVPSELVAELAREARRRLATYKRPRYYVCALEFTYGKNGKLDRQATIATLRERLEAEPARYRTPAD